MNWKVKGDHIGLSLGKQGAITVLAEDFNEEQKMIAQTCKDFLKQEIHPILDQIDSMKDLTLMPKRGRVTLNMFKLPP